jgi:hypothetical protein
MATKRPDLRAGKIWLVRIGDNRSLSMMQVETKFQKTVELRLMYDIESEAFGTTYYAWGDVEFVEMLKS